MSKYRVSVDTGGTFTDVFVFDEKTVVSGSEGTVHSRESSLGVVSGMEKAEIDMSDVTLFSHGTTVRTNALITRKLPLVDMVSKNGFRDVIEIRRSTKQDLWDYYKDAAPPYVPRRNRLEVEERVYYAGNVQVQGITRETCAPSTERGVYLYTNLEPRKKSLEVLVACEKSSM